MNKIKVYAPDYHMAARCAAGLNLALRHWEYAGESDYSYYPTWADVGSVMDEYLDLEWRMEELNK